MLDLPNPHKGAVFYEDKKLYVSLANFPISRGHTVIVWKKKVTDLHLLKRREFVHLMKIVDLVRNAMLKTFKIKKVYLIYADETNHVHWHLVPRYNRKGFNILKDKPKKLQSTSLALKLKKNLKI